MELQLLAFLHSHGLSTRPRILQEMLAEAIEQLPSMTFRRSPRRELTPAEARGIERAGFDLEPQDLGKKDPLARSMALYAGMLAKSLSVKEAALLLGVNTSRVRQRLSRERTLYGVKLRSEWRIPTFQFKDGKMIPGIEGVLSSLSPTLHPVAVLTWFMTSSPDLGIESEGGDDERRLSPREWLLVGHRPDVVAALARDL